MWICILAATIALCGTVSANEQCRDFEPWNEGACTIDSNGLRRGKCSTCLTGPEWDSLRERVGTAKVAGKRTYAPVLGMKNWISDSISISAFRIILQEILGYENVTVFSNSHGSLTAVDEAMECEAVHLEVWKADEPQMMAKKEAAGRSLVERRLGLQGSEGLYHPQYMPFTSGHYRALQINPVAEILPNGTEIRTMDGFPTDGTMGPEEISEFAPPPDFFCAPEKLQDIEWTESTCQAGRWYPPMCGGEFPSDECREMYLAFPSWSAGWYEALVKNLDLPFSAVYLGAGLQETVKRKSEDREGMLFYWWEPDPLLADVPSVELTVPEFSNACSLAHAPDPLQSGAACGRPRQQLRKMMPSAVYEAEPDLARLFDLWSLDRETVLEILRLHEHGGGPHDIEGAACAFLTSGLVNWEAWLQVTPPPPEEEPAEEEPPPTESTTASFIVPAGIGSVAALLVAIVPFACFMRCQSKRKKKEAYKQVRGSESRSVLLSERNPKPPQATHDSHEVSGTTGTTPGPNGTQELEGSAVSCSLRELNQRGIISEVQIQKLIGTGGSGSVYKGLWHGVPVALKIRKIKQGQLMQSKSRDVMEVMETMIGQAMRHPNVVQMFGSDIQEISAAGTATAKLKTEEGCIDEEVADQDKDVVIDVCNEEEEEDEIDEEDRMWEVRIIQEYCSSGCLRHKLRSGSLEGQTRPDEAPRKATPPNIGTSLTLAFDVASGLTYMHASNVIHGDLKAANILLTTRDASNQTTDCKYLAKIADFGLSRLMDVHATHMSGIYAGTLTHLAPEALQHGRQSKAADVYAFGIMLYELFSARRAFDGMSTVQITEAVVHKRTRPILPASVPVKIVQVYDNCTLHEADKRPTMTEVVQTLSELIAQYAEDPIVCATQMRMSVASRSRASKTYNRESYRGSDAATGSASTPPELPWSEAPMASGWENHWEIEGDKSSSNSENGDIETEIFHLGANNAPAKEPAASERRVSFAADCNDEGGAAASGN